MRNETDVREHRLLIFFYEHNFVCMHCISLHTAITNSHTSRGDLFEPNQVA